MLSDRLAVNWSRLTINLDPETARVAKDLARRQKRSFASYVAILIEKDIAANEQLNEPRAEYHTQQEEKPPDNSKRSGGAGPRHRVSKSA